MPYSFNAACVFAEDDGSIVTIGFADDAMSPGKCFQIQKAHEYDAQGRQLGMDKPYLEVESQERSTYGGLLTVTAGQRNLSFELDEDAARALGVDGQIDVELAAGETEIRRALDMLKRLAAAAGVAYFEATEERPVQ